MAVDALEGPEGVCWGMGGEGKSRPGGGGKLAPHSALLPRACVCAPGRSVFLPVSFSMSQTLAPWRAAPQTAGLPGPGDPPEIPAPPEPCGIMLQASNGRER